ncbi:MAG: ABC transporter substrate-binding protein [Lachnospiraceae bacterium]|nr:ABC transporter substrate-binding protein [Lachnospiraceae bacterium]
MISYFRRTILLVTVLTIWLAGCQVLPAGRPVDGVYEVPVELEGGTGRASVESPARVTVKDGGLTASLVWSSDHYDHMIVDGEKYLPVSTDNGHSVFDIPIKTMDEAIDVIADTTAMSTPHEIEYVLRFDWTVITGGTVMSGKGDISDKETADEKAGTGSLINLTGIRTLTLENGSVIPLNIKDDKGDILVFDKEIERKYAQMFSLALSDEGYTYIHTEGGGDILLLPEGTDPSSLTVSPEESIPDTYKGIEADEDDREATVLCKPIDNIYLVSSSAMDIFAALDHELSDISFCALEKDDWCVDEAVDAMDAGTLKYAGKYSAPDYELLLSGKCGLAIENTMVFHKPGVTEKLNGLGIPVLVELSSYESHPLGRVEWIKLYGLLTGRSDESVKIFDDALKEVEPVLSRMEDENEGSRPKVAFFYVTSNGAVNVRKSSDYISRMTTMAGGDYIPATAGDDEDNALSTVNMQMEAFYSAVRDADILIYNGTVGGSIGSLTDLTGKDKLFADFKAVKEGRVYTTDENLYQRTMSMPRLILDLDKIINDENVSDDELIFLNKVE